MNNADSEAVWLYVHGVFPEGQFNRFVDMDMETFVSQQEAYKPKPKFEYGVKR